MAKKKPTLAENIKRLQEIDAEIETLQNKRLKSHFILGLKIGCILGYGAGVLAMYLVMR